MTYKYFISQKAETWLVVIITRAGRHCSCHSFCKEGCEKKSEGAGGGEFEERQERRDSIIKKNRGNQIFRDVRI